MAPRPRALAPFALALGISALIGALAIGDVLEKAGRPAVPLDDVFIHFQYARRIAEGEPFRYTGDAVSTGMTSLVWPALLAPFWKLGARGLSLVWVAWALGTIAQAATAVEAALLARRLTDRTGAIVAGAACLAFGPFAWFAWSGMETMALAWILVAGARRAADLLEAGGARRRSPDVAPSPPSSSGPRRASKGADPVSPRALALLAAIGFVAPLVRPEGVLVSVFSAAAIASRARGRRRLLALVPLAGCLVLPAIFLALTGSPAGATARAKWLPYNPYYDAPRLLSQIGEHAELLLLDVLDGGEWTWIFVPKGLVLLIAFGALALVLAGRRAPWHAALTFVLFASALATCSYQTFLWNRVRYAWPFLPAAFVMCACFFHELGRRLARAHPALGATGPALGAALVVRLAVLIPPAIADLSQSAAAVDRQQVALGEWAKAALPETALVGVNDTGAIAYLGERRTLDIVGLTTDSEGPAWLAGAGSRFERYESLPRPSLPTHFLVYPEWFGCDTLLGQELARRTVEEHSILGGDTMAAYVADYSLLGSGAEPETRLADDEVLADELDVADLASEAAHAYDLHDAWEPENVARAGDAASGREIVDGGRRDRGRDTFRLSRGPHLGAARLVMRIGADEPVTVRVLAGGEEAGSLAIPSCAWIEAEIALPASSSPAARIDVIALDEHGLPVRLRSRSGPRFTSFHYWLIARTLPSPSSPATQGPVAPAPPPSAPSGAAGSAPSNR